MKNKKIFGLALAGLAGTALIFSTPDNVRAHGDVTPQAMDTSGLPKLGEEWLAENPYRDPKGESWQRAIEIGSSGYNSNCARCHGLGAVSGGLAPDLRMLSADEDGDEWYVERYRLGYTQGGITKMPAFGELLGQEAAWAIRTYLETRPDEGAMDDHITTLQGIRGKLESMVTSGKSVDQLKVEIDPLRSEMDAIAIKIETGSGAPVADSPASQAAAHLDGTTKGLAKAAEVLKVGLSAAK